MRDVGTFANMVRARVSRDALDLAEDAVTGAYAERPWSFPLGGLRTADYRADPQGAVDAVRAWHEAADAWGLDVDWEETCFGGVTVAHPRRARLPDVGAVGRVAGESCEAWRLVSRMREVMVELCGRYGCGSQVMRRHVRRIAGMPRGDYEALLVACDWFSANGGDGMTARQVPLALVHAKWVEPWLSVVSDVVGREVSLVARRREVRLRYLDPLHVASGGREFDSHVTGDVEAPAYVPSVVIVVENKDCFEQMPAVRGGICVWGEGNAHVCEDLAGIGWLTGCKHVLYWGDMDVDGYVLLDRLRRGGVAARSVCMDADTCRRYARLGTSTDASGRALSRRDLKGVLSSCSSLTEAETSAARLLVSGELGVRRIEQERVPFADVVRAVGEATGRA